jgi:hypothetical protein
LRRFLTDYGWYPYFNEVSDPRVLISDLAGLDRNNIRNTYDDVIKIGELGDEASLDFSLNVIKKSSEKLKSRKGKVG